MNIKLLTGVITVDHDAVGVLEEGLLQQTDRLRVPSIEEESMRRHQLLREMAVEENLRRGETPLDERNATARIE